MATTTTPRSARKNYALSALIARRAVREARKAQPRGVGAVAAVVAAHQLTNAQTSGAAVGEALAEQDITAPVDAALNLASFTTAADDFARMLEQVEAEARQFEQLIDDLVQDAGRAAESVSIATRPDVYHVRYLSPPSCGRCAVLAGRVYRWSEGFLRHPNCDCVMIPTTVAAPFAQDPEDMARNGQVTGLSKADLMALADGADLGQIVNVRRRAAGLREAGFSLTRGGRPTPAGIYRIASDRIEAVELLTSFGYVRP